MVYFVETYLHIGHDIGMETLIFAQVVRGVTV